MKTITVEDETWAWLSKKRIDSKAASINDIIVALIAQTVEVEAKKR